MPVRYIRSGCRYTITNVKNTNRVLDFAAGHYTSIIGWSSHGGDNQKWDLHQDSQGWSLRCVADTDIYVSVEGYHNGGYPRDGARAIGDQEPYRWHICHESDSKFRISVREVKISMPEVRVTMPEVRIFAPDVQISVPEVSISVPEVKITMPQVNISVSEARKCLGLPTHGNIPYDYGEVWVKSGDDSQLWYFDEV